MRASDDGAWPDLSQAERRVLLDLLLHGSRSRVRLSERLGLSRATLTRIARELVGSGFIVEGDVQQSNAPGRPPESLHLRPGGAHFLGVKLTGDTLYAVVTDLAARVVAEREVPLGSRSVASVVELIAVVADGLLRGRTRPAAIGVGLAGDVLRRGERDVVERSGFLGWTDAVELPYLVQQATGLPSIVTNDVHALTADHHWFGGGAGYRSLVVFGIGAGIGSGIVIDDELMEGAHGRSGRVGHTRLGGSVDRAGRRCDNGHVDCIHSFVTIPAIEQNAGVAAGDYPLALERARDGDAVALAAFQDASFALGAVVAETVNAFDPELVSLMGEGLDMLDLAPERLLIALAEQLEQVPPDAVRIERPPFHFGLYARGAAVTAMRQMLA